VKKLKMVNFECVVRGYMFGHLWEGYNKDRTFCGEAIAGEYQLAQKLEAPIFTPSTKAQESHDEYVSYKHFEEGAGRELAAKIRDISLSLYSKCYDYALSKGLIIADAKFEFGLDADGELVLADELFTPDSSRFWSLDEYEVGVSPKSFDKQYLRDWLENNKLGGKMQIDNVPDEVLKKTAGKYEECLKKLTERGN
ncbi:MAG: phosphoribosylaminoimidazolesuccinocarboxamide synthase, partial [Oscillospiraceae bacterium]|nr:phosphoribosylaminoimidazolesuccinocarboxamide synthase [Oscillospiraceae bacterium]